VSDEILRQNPNDAYVRSIMAYFSARMGERKVAESNIVQALRMAPDDTRVLFEAVVTYEALHERQASLSVLRSAPAVLLRQFDRHPDLKQLHQDPGFQQLIAGSQ